MRRRLQRAPLHRALSHWRAAAAAVAVFGTAATGVTAATAKPPAFQHQHRTIAQVTHTLDVLARHDEQLAERYNAARLETARLRRAAAAAQATAATAERRHSATISQLQTAAVSAYETGAVSDVGALLTAGTQDGALTQMRYGHLLADHLTALAAARKATAADLHAAQRTAHARLVAAVDEQHRLLAQQQRLQRRATHFKALLATLTARQRAAYARRHAVTPPPALTTATPAARAETTASARPAGDTAGERAVQFALAQVGKPYVWGAAGPDSYDCSGLTMAAWAAAGVSLPHQSAEQFSYGTPVSVDEMQPGDLIFLYQPISHVEIYAGHGLAVSAPQEGENVQLIRVADYLTDLTGVRRPG